MKRTVWAVLVVAVVGSPSPGQPPAAGSASQTAAEFTRAFNAGDAKAVAAVWTADAEMVGIDGKAIRGRTAIEKRYAELFKSQPGLTATIETGPERSLGSTLAVFEGVLTIRAKNAEPDVTVFRAIEVKEADGWKLASVKSWVPDPEAGSLADLAWLVGEWAGKTDDGELRTTYAWEEGKTFLKCKYAITKDGKEVAGGTQMFGADPDGGVRSWLFDKTGATAESKWTKDGTRWLVRSAGVSRGGIDGTATNLLVPVGKDAYTWQSVDRTVGGLPVPDRKPVKMTRAAAK